MQPSHVIRKCGNVYSGSDDVSSVLTAGALVDLEEVLSSDDDVISCCCSVCGGQ